MSLPPFRGYREGEVPSSYEGGGVMSDEKSVAHDPSARYAGTSPAKLGRKTPLPVAPAVAPRAAEDAAQDAADDATVAPPAIAPATVVPAIAPAAVVPAVAPATIVPAAVMPTTVVPAAIVPTAVAPPGKLGLGVDADIGLGLLPRLFPGIRHRTAQRLQAGGDRLVLGRGLRRCRGRIGGGERHRQPHDAARQQGGQGFDGTTVLGRVSHAKSPS